MSKTTIPTGGLADSAVTSAKITDATIATADIADSAVTLAKTSGVGGGGYTRSDSARESRRGGQYGFMGGGLVDLVDIYD